MGVKVYYYKKNLGSIFSDEIFYALIIVTAKLLHFFIALWMIEVLCVIYIIKWVLKCFLKCYSLTSSHVSWKDPPSIFMFVKFAKTKVKS